MVHCVDCGTTSNIVHSGIDAFLLGITPQTFCYDCANKNAELKI